MGARTHFFVNLTEKSKSTIKIIPKYIWNFFLEKKLVFEGACSPKLLKIAYRPKISPLGFKIKLNILYVPYSTFYADSKNMLIFYVPLKLTEIGSYFEKSKTSTLNFMSNKRSKQKTDIRFVIYIKKLPRNDITLIAIGFHSSLGLKGLN